LLPTTDKRLCTRWLKQVPLDRFAKENDYEAALCGTRRSESQRRQGSKSQTFTNQVYKYSPILDWLDVDIFEYAKLRGIPLNPIYDRGFERTGCWCCTVGQNVSDRFWQIKKCYPKKYKQLLKYLKRDKRFYKTPSGRWKYHQIKEHIDEDWIKLRVREKLIRESYNYNMLVRYWDVQIRRARAYEI